ncbi:hypothetical protein BDY21DRAFT_167593 [Lineolata rhizophorae]|uniref:Heterokaryon incompatibility domain-containing protein n=1 Tax=Lineolata rhizophorae TaxID=578093 RepID=A0A6A6PAV9_9PEZI|nr:hypothetical protein BDY21DRAFT_167593 [Lineolata rhizophorae]
MALCSLCRSIPLTNLPTLPTSFYSYHAPGHNLVPMIRDRKKIVPGEEIGFSHQPGLDSLRRSALNCELCELLEEAAKGLIANLQEAEKVDSSKYIAKEGFPPTFQLWLTQRLDRAKGFLIWTDTQNSSAYLIGGVTLSVNDDSHLSHSILGRPMTEPMGSLLTLNRARKWVETCNDCHKGCRPRHNLLPRRVIDVGENGSTEPIKLYEPTKTTGDYTILSHHGNSDHDLATISEAIRRDGLAISELPKSFQDAVTVTRHLGIRHIWIDVLCMGQSEDGGYGDEDERMDTVISNAYLSIAALGAADDSDGCFLPRPPRKYVELEYVEKSENGDPIEQGTVLASLLGLRHASYWSNYTSLDGEPLSRWAWALQDRLLAKRTLFYGSNQLFYECQSEFKSEDGFVVPCDPEYFDIPSVTARFKFADDQDKRWPTHPWSKTDESHEDRVYNAWADILWFYGDMKLPRSSDKLPALSSIAHRFQDLLQDTYVAGLWRKRLVSQLWWQKVGFRKNDPKPAIEYRGPSWSWAGLAYEAKIGRLRSEDWVEVASIVGCHVEPKGLDSCGEISGGWITLKAPVERLELSDEPERDADKISDQVKEIRAPRLRTKTGSTYGDYALLDERQGRSEIQDLELFIAVLGYRNNCTSMCGKVLRYQGLVITPTREGHYKRLGRIFVEDEKFETWDPEKGESGQSPIITLV